MDRTNQASLGSSNRLDFYKYLFLKPTIEIVVARYTAYKRSGDTFHTNSLEYEIVRCSSLANLLHRYLSMAVVGNWDFVLRPVVRCLVRKR